MRTEQVWPAEEPSSFRWYVLVLLSVGALLVALRRRGPLEAVVAGASLPFSRGSAAARDSRV
jgi:hypothetical protein